MCALYPGSEYFPGIADTNLDAFLTKFRRDAAPLFLLGMYAGLALFIMTPLLTVYIPLPSFLLPRSLLDRHADRVSSYPIYALRSLVTVLKLVAGLCWGADPAVRARLGLPALPPDPQEWRHA